ncbi:hypothetical protein RJ639_000399, partial [Escallonia herrerae]
MAIQQDIEKAGNSVQEEIKAPLLPQEKSSGNRDVFFTENQTSEGSKGNAWMLYLSTLAAICGSFAFGSCAGFSSPTKTAIRQDLNLSLAEYSLFGSILTFGAMVGAITSGPIADLIGRKGAMRMSSGFCAAGWLAIYFAQLMICTGVSVAFIIGTMLTWRTLALTESPRWLAKTGCKKEFEFALRRLRGQDTDTSEEAAEIQDYTEALQQLPKAKLLDLFQRRYLRSVIIGVKLMVFQQFGGINGICFYVSSIFESVGREIHDLSHQKKKQVVITALGALLIDRAGRKPLLLISASGLVLGCLLTAISFYLKTYKTALKAAPALAVTGILFYIGSFSAGMGAVPWVVMSEIFPINIKGVAGSLATLVNWFGACAVSYTFNFLTSWSSYGTFILYATVNAIAIFFVVMVVPETKGRTLEQIQAAIN